MKNIAFFILIILTIFACKKQEKSQTRQNIPTKEVTIPYPEFKKQINAKSSVEKKAYFFNYINNDVPKYWEETIWSFNGTSQIPKNGSIACGYFVTNILSDYGFKINRIRLAQQASSVMIKELCTEIHYFATVEELEKYVLSKNEKQIYIVGLDFHTGFIIRDVKEVYFLHSNYIKNKGVVKEIAKNSQALNQSKSFMIGTLNYK